MKIKRRIWSMLLAMCLAAGVMLVPTVAEPAENTHKAIMSVDVLGENFNSADAATLYYGTDGKTGYSWYVIGYNGSGVESSAGNMTLLARYIIGNEAAFRNLEVDLDSALVATDTYYKGSVLQEKIDAIAADLTKLEAAGIVKKTLESGKFIHSPNCSKSNSCTCTLTDCVAGEKVTDAAMWPLSLNEVSMVHTSLRYTNGRYWLRSPGALSGRVSTVKLDSLDSVGGYVHYKGSMVKMAVRPAFNMTIDNILFVSAAVDGKTATTVSPIADYTENLWKATVLDSSRGSLTVSLDSVNGGVCTFHYSGAKTGAKEYLSVLVKNEAGEYTHYGKLLQLDGNINKASGTVDVDFSGAMLKETDKVYLFNEQCNDDKRTDYAGALTQVEMPRFVPAVVVGESVKGANDGKITGVDSTMEYRKQGSSSYTAVTGTELTGLEPGKYEIRYKGESSSVMVEILAHSCIAGTQWEPGETGHFSGCTAAGCTGKVEEKHIGKIVGKKIATATEEGYTGDKVCSVCEYVIKKGETIPAKGGSTTPPTTEAGNGNEGSTEDMGADAGVDKVIIIAIAAAAVIVLGVVVVILIRKKKK